MERIVVFGALQWECTAILQALREVRRGRAGAFTCWQGRSAQREIWVVKTGVGIERASAAAIAVGTPDEVALMVSAGCAGALAPGLQPGDLTLATAVIGAGTRAPLPTDPRHRARAAAAAATVSLRVVEGPILCSAAALATSAQKRDAAVDGAIAVEMEGGPIAAHAAAAGVPFLSVRTILDVVEYELPAGPLIDPASGTLRPLAVASYVATHAGAFRVLLDLRRMQSAARDSLARFFIAWLDAQSG